MEKFISKAQFIEYFNIRINYNNETPKNITLIRNFKRVVEDEFIFNADDQTLQNAFNIFKIEYFFNAIQELDNDRIEETINYTANNIQHSIAKYKKNNHVINELKMILEDTSAEYQKLLLLVKEQVEIKKQIDVLLGEGTKIKSEGWSFNKGVETVRKTPNNSKIKALQELIDKSNLYFKTSDKEVVNISASLYEETKIAPRLTITAPKKMTADEINRNTEEKI